MTAFDAVRSLANDLPPSPLLAPEHDPSLNVMPVRAMTWPSAPAPASPSATQAEQLVAFSHDGRRVARALMDEFRTQYGQGPQQWHGHDEVSREVAKALRLPAGADPQLAANVAERLVHLGGENPRVTPLPVVVGVFGEDGGLVLTGVFKVELPGGGTRIVDAHALDYADFDDFRHHNQLPRVDATMVTPSRFDYTDDGGRLDLFEGDARIEGSGEQLMRTAALPVGVAAGVAGVVLAAGSFGALSGPGAVLAANGLAMITAKGVVAAASLYGVAATTASVSEKAAHGANLNPVENPEIALDYANGTLAIAAVATMGYTAATGREIARGLGTALGLGGLAMTGVDGVTLALDWDRMSPTQRHERLLMTGLNVGGAALHGVAALQGRVARPPQRAQELAFAPPNASRRMPALTTRPDGQPWFSLRPPAAPKVPSSHADTPRSRPMFALSRWDTPMEADLRSRVAIGSAGPAGGAAASVQASDSPAAARSPAANNATLHAAPRGGGGRGGGLPERAPIPAPPDALWDELMLFDAHLRLGHLSNEANLPIAPDTIGLFPENIVSAAVQEMGARDSEHLARILQGNEFLREAIETPLSARWHEKTLRDHGAKADAAVEHFVEEARRLLGFETAEETVAFFQVRGLDMFDNLVGRGTVVDAVLRPLGEYSAGIADTVEAYRQVGPLAPETGDAEVHDWHLSESDQREFYGHMAPLLGEASPEAAAAQLKQRGFDIDHCETCSHEASTVILMEPSVEMARVLKAQIEVAERGVGMLRLARAMADNLAHRRESLDAAPTPETVWRWVKEQLEASGLTMTAAQDASGRLLVRAVLKNVDPASDAVLQQHGVSRFGDNALAQQLQKMKWTVARAAREYRLPESVLNVFVQIGDVDHPAFTAFVNGTLEALRDSAQGTPEKLAARIQALGWTPEQVAQYTGVSKNILELFKVKVPASASGRASFEKTYRKVMAPMPDAPYPEPRRAAKAGVQSPVQPAPPPKRSAPAPVTAPAEPARSAPTPPRSKTTFVPHEGRPSDHPDAIAARAAKQLKRERAAADRERAEAAAAAEASKATAPAEEAPDATPDEPYVPLIFGMSSDELLSVLIDPRIGVDPNPRTSGKHKVLSRGIYRTIFPHRPGTDGGVGPGSMRKLLSDLHITKEEFARVWRDR